MTKKKSIKIEDTTGLVVSERAENIICMKRVRSKFRMIASFMHVSARNFSILRGGGCNKKHFIYFVLK